MRQREASFHSGAMRRATLSTAGANSEALTASQQRSYTAMIKSSAESGQRAPGLDCITAERPYFVLARSVGTFLKDLCAVQTRHTGFSRTRHCSSDNSTWKNKMRI